MPRVLILCEYPTLNGGERSMLATHDGVRAAGFVPLVAAPPQGPLAETLAARGIEVVPFDTVTVRRGSPDSAETPDRRSPGVQGDLRSAVGARSGDRAQRGFRGAKGDSRRPLGQLREELAGLIRRVAPDLLHANSLAMGRLSGPVAAEMGVPSLAHLRDIMRLSRQAVADLNCHTRLLAVSHATRDYHAAQGLAAEKLHVLYNGVDLEKFRPRPPTGWLHDELGLPREVPLVGTIGQICLRKGQDVLVQAAAMLDTETSRMSNVEIQMTKEAQRPEARSAFGHSGFVIHSSFGFRHSSFPAHFLIIGQRFSDKDESRRFEAELHRAAAGPLAGRLHFLGERDDVDRILNELALLVHPARQEPLGRVLLEAAAAGTPVIATDVGGTAEIFSRRVSVLACPMFSLFSRLRLRKPGTLRSRKRQGAGTSEDAYPTPAARLVPAGDPAALAAAIEDLLGDPDARQRQAAAARKLAEQLFDDRVAGAGLARHYGAICGDG